LPDFKSEFEKANLVEPTLSTDSPLHFSQKVPVGSLFIGRFRVDALLGAGGAGQVYKCLDMTVNRPVALKILSSHLNEKAFRRFQTEAAAIDRLDHQSLIRIFEFGLSADGEPYIVMEFFEGESLSDLLKKKTTLSPEQCIDLFLPVVEALQVMHTSGVVHRDLKPGNILVSNKTGNLVAKIVDFGIAKIISETVDGQPQLTQTGEIFGSPLYMSPEQTRGEKIDSRTDQYSLGCMIFECLTGTPPHVGKSSIETLIKHQTELSPTLREASLGSKFPLGLERAVAKLLEKEPAKRYASMHDVSNEFTTCLTAVSAGGAREKSSVSKSLATSPLITIVASIVALVACFTCWYLFFHENPTDNSLAASSSFDGASLTPSPLRQGANNSSVDSERVIVTRGDKLLSWRIKRVKSDTTEQASELDVADRGSSALEGNKKFTEFVQRHVNANALSINPSLTKDKLRTETELTFVDDISDSGMENFKFLKRLERVWIRNSIQITDIGLKSLMQLPLREVLIEDLAVHDETVSRLLGVPTIQILAIRPLKPEQVTSEALKNIPAYARSVAFLKTNIDDQGLNYLAHDLKLQGLTLNDCRVTNKGLKYIEKLPLSFLSLEGTKISDDAAESISKLNLSQLHVSRTAITDKFLKRLGPMKKLTDLRIAFCHIAPVTVAEFQSQHPLCHVTVVDTPSGR
jgi:serine/threonine protein kinase